MALKVWLPLDGDLRNLGISNLNMPSNNTLTLQSNGKIGKCYSGQAVWHLTNELLENKWSVCAWIKADSWYSANNLILCKNINTGDAYQIYFSIIGGTQIRLGINSNSGIIFNYTFNTGTWYHVAASYNGSQGSIYINGILQISATVSNAFVSDMNNIGINCRASSVDGTSRWIGDDSIHYINDVRIYDHCLSAAEVKEISQGLVLHYKLDNNGQGGRNLAPHSSNFSGWSVGSGWTKLEEDGSTIYHYERTGATSNTWNRLIPNLHLNPNDYPNGITVSLDFKCDDMTALNHKTIGALQIYRDDNVRVGWYEAQWDLSNCISGQWQRISRTYTQAQLKTNNNSSYPNATIAYTTVSFQLVQNGSIYIKHIKIEEGNTATAYSLAPEDYGGNSNIVEDSSGYNHNGTITGTLALSLDTPRHSAAMTSRAAASILNSNSTIPTSLTTNNKYTMCAWLKTNATNNRWIYSIGNGTGGHRGLWLASNGSKPHFAYGGSGAFTATTTVNDNAWHHIVFTVDGATSKCFVDGTQCGSSTSTKTDVAGNNNITITFNGSDIISDFRLYCTALSAADILSLYHTSAKIDNKGNFHAFEFIEASEIPKIYKTGIHSNTSIIEECSIISNGYWSYNPTGANNSCASNLTADFSDFVNLHMPLKLTIEGDISWSNITPNGNGTFAARFQGNNQQLDDTWIWAGTNYAHPGTNQTSAMTSSATGTQHFKVEKTIPASWFDTYKGSHISYRTDYATGTITLSNFSITVTVDNAKIREENTIANEFIEF